MMDDYCSLRFGELPTDIFLIFGIVFEFINSHGKNSFEYIRIPLWKWTSRSMEFKLSKIPRLVRWSQSKAIRKSVIGIFVWFFRPFIRIVLFPKLVWSMFAEWMLFRRVLEVSHSTVSWNHFSCFIFSGIWDVGRVHIARVQSLECLEVELIPIRYGEVLRPIYSREKLLCIQEKEVNHHSCHINWSMTTVM